MSKFQIAYIPVGVPTFHLESAQKEFEKSVCLLQSLSSDQCACPEKMLLSMDLLEEYLDKINPDCIILQNITFANAAYPSEVLKRFQCPVLLWTLREPVIDGGRLRLNSLTGAYSAGNALMMFRDCNFEYVFGGPDETEVKETIRAFIRASRLKKALSGLKIASVGHTPQGFGFGRAMDADLLKWFGVTLDSIEARELISQAKNFTDEECGEYLQRAEKSMKGLEKIDSRNVKDFARLYKAYETYVTENHIGAISSRCWPDFFTDFGTPVCAVLAMLNDAGIVASCESDTYGALSMYMGAYLTGSPVFFGDPVSMDEKENTITYWHCGTAACSLAREPEGAEAGLHCNRHIGPTMEFGCKACDKVTVFRIGRTADSSFRFFLTTGKALDKPKQFYGTSVVVETEHPAKEIVYRSVRDGWEPHFVVIYGDVSRELEFLGNMLDIKVEKY